MTSLGFIQIVLFLSVLLACVKPLWTYMACLYQNERTVL